MSNRDQARKYPLSMPRDWEPPYPSFMSEFDSDKTQVSMALVGCQFSRDQKNAALEFVRAIKAMITTVGKADYVDVSECLQDSVQKSQLIVTAYWFSAEAVRLRLC